jgi:catechol 2,3-dioxygenase-like lactoylglutathione lyase family enzyme
VIEAAVPTLPSRNLDETLAFFERLGFQNRGAPPGEWDYLIIGRDGGELHFFLARTVDPLTTDAGCYVRVIDADALFEEWQRLEIAEDPTTGSRLVAPSETEYGMREFAVVDPSGNLLRFGSPTA